MTKVTTGSPAYERAYQIFIVAGKQFRAVTSLYQTRKIDDGQYLKARRIYLDAHKQMDIAEENELTS